MEKASSPAHTAACQNVESLAFISTPGYITDCCQFRCRVAGVFNKFIATAEYLAANVSG
jgi:hypothetical protein